MGSFAYMLNQAKVLANTEYDKIDNELSKLIMRVNGLYNIYDENGVDEDDVDYLLYQVDKIYEIIRDKYGDI